MSAGRSATGAEIVFCLGIVQLRRGQVGEAGVAWTETLAMFSELGAPQAADVRQQLQALEQA